MLTRKIIKMKKKIKIYHKKIKKKFKMNLMN